MLSDTLWLTIATVLGLALGFLRELLLLNSFGASAALDAMIIALFLPEAIRIVLGGGGLAAALLPLWLSCEKDKRHAWSATQTLQLVFLTIILCGAMMLAASYVIALLAPGMKEQTAHDASGFFSITIWCLPAIVLHAVLATIHQAERRFFLQGLAGVFFNLPALFYLSLTTTPDLKTVAWCAIFGSLLMPLPLLRGAWRAGWRPFSSRFDIAAVAVLYRRLGPLIFASAANQSVVWVERAVASMLGEGTIVLVNLARKLINIIAVGLMSLGQVLLSHFSGADRAKAASLLQNSVRWLLILCVPVVSACILFARPLIAVLPVHLSADQQQTLAWLVMGFAMAVPLAAFNMVFARWRYGHGDTASSTKVELFGMALQASLAFLLAKYFGVLAIPAAGLIATATMSWLFVQFNLVPLRMQQLAIQLAVIALFGSAAIWIAPSISGLGVIATFLLCPLTALLLSGLLYFCLPVIRAAKG